MAADGTVTIKAILDAAGVTGGIKQIKQGLADVKDAASKVTFDELKTGGTNATALSGSLKSLGGTVTQHVTMPIAGMGGGYLQKRVRLRHGCKQDGGFAQPPEGDG